MRQHTIASEHALETAIRTRRGTSMQFLNPSDRERFLATLSAVPNDVTTVLDVGCGLGVLTDALGERGFDARGVDIDTAAMEQMMSPHDVGSIASLPYLDRSFDAVVANEILEHLPLDDFEAARREMARVAAQAVVITVPNGESLESASTKCPRCQCVYSIHGHVRRFDRPDLHDLIPGFRLGQVQTVGPFKVRHRTIEWLLRRRLLGRWPTRPGAKCPQCGYRQPGVSATTELGANEPSTGAVLRAIAGVPWHRWWFLAVYRRRE